MDFLYRRRPACSLAYFRPSTSIFAAEYPLRDSTVSSSLNWRGGCAVQRHVDGIRGNTPVSIHSFKRYVAARLRYYGGQSNRRDTVGGWYIYVCADCDRFEQQYSEFGWLFHYDSRAAGSVGLSGLRGPSRDTIHFNCDADWGSSSLYIHTGW